jgi:hypothetical protein
MRRIFQLSVLCLAVGACKPDTVITTENIPTSGVRFINAVPDSAGAFGMDLRFVDIVESNAQFRITFRNGPATTGSIIASAQTEYKGARAGSRHFVIFLDDTLQAIASTVIKDTTVTLEAGKNYTALLWGAARAGGAPQFKLTFYEEAVPDPGQQVALRVINATASAIDVRQYVQGGAVPAGATWANVPAQSISTYTNVAPALIMFNVQPAGGGTNLFADVQAIPGAAASSSAGTTKLDIAALPGSTVPGSALTLVVYPKSTTGARTPQTAAFLVPGGAFMWDRRPPAVPGT